MASDEKQLGEGYQINTTFQSQHTKLQWSGRINFLSEFLSAEVYGLSIQGFMSGIQAAIIFYNCGSNFFFFFFFFFFW